MAISYLRSQTVMIAIISGLAVTGTFLYVRSQTPPVSEKAGVLASAAKDAGTQKADLAPASGDWRTDFFGAATGTASVPAAKGSSGAQAEPLTLTDRLGRNFLANYLELEQSGLTNDKQSVQDAMSQTLADTAKSTSVPRSYQLRDIKISESSDAASARAYGNAVAAILSAYMPRVGAPDIANDALGQDDLSQLAKIDPIIASYDTIIRMLLAVPAPQPLAGNHVQLIDSVSYLRFVSQGMRNISSDPMQAIVALGAYGTAQDSLHGALIGLKNYFTAARISFAGTESGVLLSTIQ